MWFECKPVINGNGDLMSQKLIHMSTGATITLSQACGMDRERYKEEYDNDTEIESVHFYHAIYELGDVKEVVFVCPKDLSTGATNVYEGGWEYFKSSIDECCNVYVFHATGGMATISELRELRRKFGADAFKSAVYS